MDARVYDPHQTDRMRALQGRELASFWRRAAAYFVDLGLGATLFMLLVLAVVYASGEGGGLKMTTPDDRAAQAEGGGTMLQLNFFTNWYSVAWWVLYFGLSAYVGNGQTPGKRVMRIRAVSLVHERLSLWHSIERALGYGASALEFGFGFVQYFIHPNRRTVHDRIAETIVVTDPRKGRVLQEASRATAPDSPGEAEQPPPETRLDSN